MNVSNLSSISQQVLSVAKAGGDTAVHKPASGGNSLPALEQPHLPVQSLQNENVKNLQKQDVKNLQNEDGKKLQDENAKSLQPSKEELTDLVAKANEATLVRSSDLKFSVAEGSDISVVRIEDSITGELIRQIPSEDMVALARALNEQRQGVVLEEEV